MLSEELNGHMQKWSEILLPNSTWTTHLDLKSENHELKNKHNDNNLSKDFAGWVRPQHTDHKGKIGKWDESLYKKKISNKMNRIRYLLKILSDLISWT